MEAGQWLKTFLGYSEFWQLGSALQFAPNCQQPIGLLSNQSQQDLFWVYRGKQPPFQPRPQPHLQHASSPKTPTHTHSRVSSSSAFAQLLRLLLLLTWEMLAFLLEDNCYIINSGVGREGEWIVYRPYIHTINLMASAIPWTILFGSANEDGLSTMDEVLC